MRELQARIIAELRVAPRLDPDAEIERRVAFLAEYLRATAARGYVLGISGGQDSALAGALCRRAADVVTGSGGHAEFVAVRLPYGRQQDEDDARLALDFIGPHRTVDLNIRDAVDALAASYDAATGTPLRDFTKGNVKARMRMVALYALAGSGGLLVAGADHAAEDVTGFSTKFGDSAADVAVLAGLTKRQGRALLRRLGAPERLLTKAPTADLLDDDPGQTDESSLGLSYESIDDYLEGVDVDDETASRLESLHRASAHKRHRPVGVGDAWWRPGADPAGQ